MTAARCHRLLVYARKCKLIDGISSSGTKGRLSRQCKSKNINMILKVLLEEKINVKETKFWGGFGEKKNVTAASTL